MLLKFQPKIQIYSLNWLLESGVPGYACIFCQMMKQNVKLWNAALIIINIAQERLKKKDANFDSDLKDLTASLIQLQSTCLQKMC